MILISSSVFFLLCVLELTMDRFILPSSFFFFLIEKIIWYLDVNVYVFQDSSLRFEETRGILMDLIYLLRNAASNKRTSAGRVRLTK